MILMQLKKKLCKKIKMEEWEEEKVMAKVLEFNKTDNIQNIDMKVSKKSPVTIPMMKMMKMTIANWFYWIRKVTI